MYTILTLGEVETPLNIHIPCKVKHNIEKHHLLSFVRHI